MNRSLQSLRNYLDKGSENTGWAPTPGVVVVGAGKGGVGTSTVSALLALAGAMDGRTVLLVDCDEGVGSLHHILGLPDSGPGLGDLRGGDLTPPDLLRSVTPSLAFLPGGGGGQEATLSLSLGERRALYQRVSSLYPEFDMVVLDGGSHLASVSAACAAGAERLLALATPDRVAMAATYALLKVTSERFPSLPVEVLVNLQDESKSEEAFHVMSAAGNRFLGLDFSFAGSIPRDPELVGLSQAGLPLSNLDFSAPSFQAADLIQSRIAAEQAFVQDGSTAILSGAFPG